MMTNHLVSISPKKQGKTKDAVIVHLPNSQAIASYLMTLVRFLEAHADGEMSQYNETIKQLKQDFEPLLPKVSE